MVSRKYIVIYIRCRLFTLYSLCRLLHGLFYICLLFTTSLPLLLDTHIDYYSLLRDCLAYWGLN